MISYANMNNAKNREERRDVETKIYEKSQNLWHSWWSRTGEVDFPDIWENSGQSWQEVDVV